MTRCLAAGLEALEGEQGLHEGDLSLLEGPQQAAEGVVAGDVKHGVRVGRQAGAVAVVEVGEEALALLHPVGPGGGIARMGERGGVPPEGEQVAVEAEVAGEQ